MSAITCDRCRGLLIAASSPLHHADVAAHLPSCAECRRVADALHLGEAAWLEEDAAAFSDGVLARTSVADALAAELPALAEMDPGPGFTERVLLHTSRRPAPQRWRAQFVAAWRALARRPRFAWEAAYVATLCWVLIFGNPLSAWEWGQGKVSAVAQQRIGRAASNIRQDLEAWRARLVVDAPETASAPAGGATAAPDAQSAFEASWKAASAWVRGQLAQVVDAFADLWRRVAAWLEGTDAAGPPAPATEPRGEAARSPQ